MKTVGEILKLSSEFLNKKGVGRSKRSSEELLAFVIGMNRLDLYLNFEKPLENHEIERLRALVQRAGAHEPVEYILGSTDFHHCHLEVTPDVLIPRKETELFVEIALDKMQKSEISVKTVVDLCTGSGCIAIAIKKARPDLRVIATDISEAALEVARANAKKNEVEIEFLQGDLTGPLEKNRVDFVLSNPPYVSTDEYGTLASSVRDFEPKQALIAGDRGLDYYKRLVVDVPGILNPGGGVLFEMGSTQGKDLQNIFLQALWKKKEVLEDYTGRDRFFFLEIQ